MKLKILLVTLVASVIVTINAENEVEPKDEEAWKNFKTKFNKSYESEEEEARRMKVFVENLHYIESQNTKSNSKFKQDVHILSDLTSEEIVKSRCGFRVNPGFERAANADTVVEKILLAVNASEEGIFERVLQPVELDWRVRGRVSKVKDQGECAGCWAFAATGALEGILSSKHKGILLSEQNLLDCSSSYDTAGCGGGSVESAFQYIKDNGIMSNADYPYVGKVGSCSFQRGKSRMSLLSSVILPFGNENLLRLALAIAGPIPVSIDATPRAFHNYKSGVYDEAGCQNGLGYINHAVLLVGYGTDTVSGDYWLIKNSWGDKWGDNGYVRIARNNGNFCGVASYAILPIPPRSY